MKASNVSAWSVCLLAVLAVPVMCFGDMPYGYKTVFRYRSFSGSLPAWVSPIDSVGGINHASSSAIHTINRGSGFDNFISTIFNGTSQYIRASSAIDTNDTLGNDSFTAQAWFYADNVTGYRTLISNTHDNRGFSLKLQDGQLRGQMYLANGAAFIDYELKGGTIEAGKWYHAAFRVHRGSVTYDVRLFLNGEQVAGYNPARYGGIRQSSERPMVGAEPQNGAPEGHYFSGRIYGAAVANYAMDLNYLQSKVMRDGSRYFGSGSYHDYLDAREGMDWRMQKMFSSYPDVNTVVTERFYVPLMNDNYVPQGMATNGKDTVYMSMYWMDTDGNKGAYASVVTESSVDGRLKRVYQLRRSNNTIFTGHVGGLAYWNDYLYVPSGTTIMRYNIASVSGPEFDGETFANPRHDSYPIRSDVSYNCSSTMSPNTGISYMSASVDYDGTPILWVGQFDDSEIKYMFGFRILSNGGISTTPLYTFRLPIVRVQGVYCHQANRDTMRFYMSRSYGNNASFIYDVTYNKTSQFHQSIVQRFRGPAGLEDIAMLGSELWCVSESGARYYQKRSSSPWTDLYPFVFSCRFYRQGDINRDGVVDVQDLLLLSSQWLDTPGQPSADIAGTWGDGFVDFLDFAQLASDWQKNVLP